MKLQNKIKLIPDYSREIDTIFLTSPLSLRDNCWKEFIEFLKIIIDIINLKNTGQRVVICCRNEVLEQTKTLILEDKFFKEFRNKFGKEHFDLTLNFKGVEILDIWIRDYLSCGNFEYGNEIGTIKAIYSPNYNSLALIDDAAGYYLSQLYFDKVINIPLKIDGGNVISNSEYIFISEKLYTENITIGKKEIDKFFEENFEQKLIILPTELLDVVGHTDCILRFLDDKTILLPIYDSEYKRDNRYVMTIKNLLSEKLGVDYKFIFLPSVLDDQINDDNIFSANGIFLNFFRFEDHIIFPKFKNLEYYENKIIEIISKAAPDIKIHFCPCDNISFYGGCFNCISNVKYK